MVPIEIVIYLAVLSIWVFATFAMRKRVDDGLLVSWFLKV